MIHNPHLEGGPFLWEGGPVGVLLVHGFTATTAEVRPLGQALHARGYTVAGPLLPGHGTRPEDLNRVSWQDWAAAVEAMYRHLQERCEVIVAGGESTGGLLALHLATHHPEIAALLLYAPALKLTLRRRDVLGVYLLSPFVQYVRKKRFNAGASLWQGYPVNPLKGTIQLLRLQRVVRRLLPRIRQPVLIVQGEKDPTVHPSVPDTIAAEIGSAVKEIVWMPESAHTVIVDKELDRVVQITLRFLESQAPTEITEGPN